MKLLEINLTGYSGTSETTLYSLEHLYYTILANKIILFWIMNGAQNVLVFQ